MLLGKEMYDGFVKEGIRHAASALAAVEINPEANGSSLGKVNKMLLEVFM